MRTAMVTTTTERRKAAVNRPRLNFLVDVVAFTAFAFLTTTGVLSRYVLPPGSGRYATLWGLNRHGWGDVHFWVAVVLLAILALHLVLHWKWILYAVKGKRSEASGVRLALGVVGLVGLLGLAAAPLTAPVEQTGVPRQAAGMPASSSPHASTAPAGASAPPEPAQSGLETIRGSMTLREVERSTGVPVDALITRLGLPHGIDPDERIGRIRKRYDISPDDVRQAVLELRGGQ
jgi:hypothetical protein